MEGLFHFSSCFGDTAFLLDGEVVGIFESNFVFSVFFVLRQPVEKIVRHSGQLFATKFQLRILFVEVFAAINKFV